MNQLWAVAAILSAAAKHELLLLEGARFMPRPVHPELAVYKRSGG